MITILCSGSRGDFQPYIALAQELKKLGKAVRITGMREFECFIKSYGIDFYPIQADFKSLNVDENMEYISSKELADFLSSGEKPVYIGFGSVFHMDQKETLSKLIIDSLRKANKRGIICGMGKLDNLPSNIITIDNIPHTWLFDRVAAVCHHGGAGTTSAGFAAGVPSIIIPFANDQHAWAHRAYDLGVGSKPISIKKLTSDNLAEAFKYVLTDKVVQNAKKLSINISAENGATDCAKVILNTLSR